MVGNRLLAFRGKFTPSCTLYRVVLLVNGERWWSNKVECVIDQIRGSR